MVITIHRYIKKNTKKSKRIMLEYYKILLCTGITHLKMLLMSWDTFFLSATTDVAMLHFHTQDFLMVSQILQILQMNLHFSCRTCRQHQIQWWRTKRPFLLLTQQQHLKDKMNSRLFLYKHKCLPSPPTKKFNEIF